MLPNDKKRRFDDEPEIAVLERAAVGLPHQESDQPSITLAHLVGCLVERDARAVDHGEIGGQRPVQRDKTVVEDLDCVLG